MTRLMVEHVNLNFLNLKHSLIFLIIFSQLLRKNKIFSNNCRLTEFFVSLVTAPKTLCRSKLVKSSSFELYIMYNLLYRWNNQT